MIQSNVGQAIVKVIADSVNPTGQRITTLQLEYQRFIHAEFMTHRMFSRNASSSRAIPVSRMLDQVMNNPALPIHWGANQSGMQAAEENTELVQVPVAMRGAYEAYCVPHDPPAEFMISAEEAWKFTAWMAGAMSHAFAKAGYHKQVANRLTEPFQTMKVVVTATDWENYFALRLDPAAQPEIRDLALAMRSAMRDSVAVLLPWGGYHLPYCTQHEQPLTLHGKLMVCTARCARVSYDRHDGEPAAHTADFALHDRLVGSWPQHFSPAEHSAVAIQGQYSNFKGWASYRWQLEHGITITE